MRDFQPDERQRHLTEEADRLHAQAMKSGRFVSRELLRRMQDEQGQAFYVAALQETVELNPKTREFRPPDAETAS